MEQLIRGTAAYKIFSGDAKGGKLSHAYMLYFADRENLRSALKLFALKFFGAEQGSREERLILAEGLPDLKVYPAKGAKLTAADAAAILDDAVKKPLEYDKKLYIISDFDSAAPLFQNKLLKILEEPPKGVSFLLGATSLAPVLDTIKSRVKTLEIMPFSEEQIFAALERGGSNPLNRAAAGACGGILGTAQTMVGGGWYKSVREAAEELCSASTVGQAADAAQRFGDFKYKKELMAEMQRVYFSMLKGYATDCEYKAPISVGAVSYALESISGALADIRFNANFGALLYDFMLRVVTAAK